MYYGSLPWCLQRDSYKHAKASFERIMPTDERDLVVGFIIGLPTLNPTPGLTLAVYHQVFEGHSPSHVLSGKHLILTMAHMFSTSLRLDTVRSDFSAGLKSAHLLDVQQGHV